MAKNKKSFILYADWIHPIKQFSNEEIGILFNAIMDFVNNEPYEVTEDLEGLFEAIKEQIVYEWSKFNPKTGKYHWNYQGGITPENKVIRNSTQMKQWRISVFERDDYTCQICFQKGGTLNAHHIKRFSLYPELRFNVENGLTLCKECHIQEHRNNK